MRAQLQYHLVNLCAELGPALGADVPAGEAAMRTLPAPVQPLAHLLVLDDCQNSLPSGLICQQPLLRQDRLQAGLSSQSITGDMHDVRELVLRFSQHRPPLPGHCIQSCLVLGLLGSLSPSLRGLSACSSVPSQLTDLRHSPTSVQAASSRRSALSTEG